MTGTRSEPWSGFPLWNLSFFFLITEQWTTWYWFYRVVSLSLCSRNDCFISGSLDRTVLLWDQRAEKCQVQSVKCILNLLNYLLIDLCWKCLSGSRVFYMFKGDQLQLMMIKDLFLLLLLEDTLECLTLGNMKRSEYIIRMHHRIMSSSYSFFQVLIS